MGTNVNPNAKFRRGGHNFRSIAWNAPRFSAVTLLTWRVLIPILALMTCGVLIAASAFAQDSAARQVFEWPAAAAIAFANAAKNNNIDALGSILGSDGKEILSSGDPVADQNARDKFAAKYAEMHRLAYDDRGRVILYLGAENWPLPIPLVKQNDGWTFDTAAGKRELLYRRVGQNELFTIGVLDDLANAEADYASEVRDGASATQYAQKIVSDAGEHNGLYWPVAAGEPESPIGPLIAKATAEGYKKEGSAPVPFHGYYYRVLTRQGGNAPGGKKNYVQDGKMTNGFAFLAYPAEYRSSGVMTFMINQDGVVVQKDLGAHTSVLASKISDYNPDQGWDQVVER